MIARKFSILLLVCPLLVSAQTVDQVSAAMDRYFGAYSAGNAYSVQAMTYPRVIAAMGGEEKAEQFFRHFFQTQRKAGLMPYSHQIERIEYFDSPGSKRIHLLTRTEFVRSFPTDKATRKLTVVITDPVSDKLAVLDLGCISAKWIDSAAPEFGQSTLAKRLVDDGLLQRD